MSGSTYLRRDCWPLSEIALRSPHERGQLSVLDGDGLDTFAALAPGRAAVHEGARLKEVSLCASGWTPDGI
jgi:hypothetical protein